MKKLLKLLTKKSETGFSLIELMIVVVIIGILSTVAVPQYQNFQKKAKQSEAKAALSGLYTTMKTFQAEWNQYYSDFRATGFDQTGNLTYGVGFAAAGPAGPLTHPSYPNAAAVQYHSQLRCGTVNGKNNECTIATGADRIPAGTQILNTAGNQVFTAGARGNIDSDTAVDRWTINQLKVLSQPLATERDIERTTP